MPTRLPSWSGDSSSVGAGANQFTLQGLDQVLGVDGEVGVQTSGLERADQSQEISAYQESGKGGQTVANQAKIKTARDETGLSDLELVDRLLHGTPDAFEMFYRRHQRLIYHCVRASADAMDVEDLVHGWFERLLAQDYRMLRLWQRGTSLPLYLSRVIRNFVIDFYRAKRSREKTADAVARLALIDRPPLKEGTMAGAPPRVEDITPALELRDLRRLGLQVWASLDRRDRFLVCGKLHRELSHHELATRLGLTEGALRTALSRAQSRLLAGLKIKAPEYFPAKL